MPQFRDYFIEGPSRKSERILKGLNPNEHKIEVWNAFVDSDLDGINDDDFSIFPRLLPMSYFRVIENTAKKITLFTLRLLSLPEREILSILPRGPIRDYLIEELQVLKYRPKRMVGSFRFDMAVVGPPDRHHPPQLLEINEIGFDGLSRATFFQETLLKLIPDLKKNVLSLDSSKAEIQNMKRLGKSLARLQYDSYNWDEELLVRAGAKDDFEIRLISPEPFKCKIDSDYPRLKREKVQFKKNRVTFGKEFVPDAVNLSFAFSLKDYIKGADFYRRLIRSDTPQYGPFITGLVASKAILVLFDDPHLRRKLLGSENELSEAILPAWPLEANKFFAEDAWDRLVIKHVDGFGGQQVFMGQELLNTLQRIPKSRYHEWILQKKTKLNLIQTNGILSRPKKAISDLGVFVQYDWNGNDFRHFKVGGLMSRATNKSLKVNVSGGGLQVAVLLDRGR